MRGDRWLAARRLAYRCLLDPYTNFRPEPCEARAFFGSRFVGRLSGHVQRRIFHFGIYEPNLTDFVRSRLRVGDVFVDVGANVGYFSMLASTLVGIEGNVVAIEAAPSTFGALEGHVRRNGAANVRTVHAAAYDRETTVSIHHLPSEEHTGGASVVNAIGPVEALVRARPLAAMLTDDELRRTRLIKIDVEGAEREVLGGFRDALARLPDTAEIVVETLPETCEDVCTIMMHEGFHAYILQNPADPLDQVDGPRRPMRMLPDFPARHRASGNGVAYIVFSTTEAAAL